MTKSLSALCYDYLSLAGLRFIRKGAAAFFHLQSSKKVTDLLVSFGFVLQQLFREGSENRIQYGIGASI